MRIIRLFSSGLALFVGIAAAILLVVLFGVVAGNSKVPAVSAADLPILVVDEPLLFQQVTLTPTVIATMTVGTKPTGVAVNPNTNLIYVSNFISNSLSVIDGATNTVVSTIPVNSGPHGVAVNPLTNRIYVGIYYGSVSVIDGDTNTVIDSIPAGTSAGISVNPLTNRIYVTDHAGTRIAVIDGNTNTVIDWVEDVGNLPCGIAINQVTNRIYVANYGSNDVAVIDGNTNELITNVPVGNTAVGVGVNPNTNRVYASNLYSDNLSVIDGATNVVVDTIAVGHEPNGVNVNPNTNRIYVSNRDSVSVIDGNTNAVVATVTVGAAHGIAVNPITNRTYAANHFGTTVSVIAYVADLSVSMSNVRYSTTITYTLVASNTGPSGAGGAVVSDTFPSGITHVTWTCIEAGGAICANANGSGNIQETVDLPFFGVLTYTAIATLSDSLTGVVNIATIESPTDMTDPVPENNETVKRSYAWVIPIFHNNWSP